MVIWSTGRQKVRCVSTLSSVVLILAQTNKQTAISSKEIPKNSGSEREWGCRAWGWFGARRKLREAARDIYDSCFVSHAAAYNHVLSPEEGAPHPRVLSQWQSQSYGKTEVLPLHPAGKMFSIPMSENKNYRAPNKTHPKTHLKHIRSAGKTSVFYLEQGFPLYPFSSFLHFIFIYLFFILNYSSYYGLVWF